MPAITRRGSSADGCCRAGKKLASCRQPRITAAIIEHLRDNGSMIVATLQQGYWLTEDSSLWRDYLEGRQIDAKRVLGETHKRKRQLTEGQGFLFDMRINCGVATCGVA